MKNTIIGIALTLALILGAAAYAETAEPAIDPAPAVTEEAPAEETPEIPEASAEVEKVEDLQSALHAFRAAKEAKKLDELEAELDEYVEDGSLTQAQADLILDSVKERLAAKNGECPSCGYKFQNNDRQPRNGFPGMGGQNPGQFQNGNGQRGGRMNGGRQMQGSQAPNGQMPNNQVPGSQAPDAQSGATPRQNNGQAPRR